MSHTISRDHTRSMHRRALQSRVQMVVIWVRASLRGWTSAPEGLKGCQKPPDLHNPTYMLCYLEGGGMEEDSHCPQLLPETRLTFFMILVE